MTAPAKLSDKDVAFIDRYFAQGARDPKGAYKHVYPKCKLSAAQMLATKLMKRPEIKEEILRRRLLNAGATETPLNPSDLLRELRAIVVADPRELMEYRRGACRYCHGYEFKYHRTPAEYENDLEEYRRNNTVAALKGLAAADPLGALFQVRGGIGYNPTVKPHKACPECFGHGIGYSYIKDSRNVSKAAARLFVGVKETAHGVEIKTRSTDRSVELLMRNLGMLEPDPTKGKQSPAELAAAVREHLLQAGATLGGPAK